MPNIGYGTDKKTRHYLPNKFKKFVVHNVSELELLMMHNRYEPTQTDACWYLQLCSARPSLMWRALPFPVYTGPTVLRSPTTSPPRSARISSSAPHSLISWSPTSSPGSAVRRMSRLVVVRQYYIIQGGSGLFPVVGKLVLSVMFTMEDVMPNHFATSSDSFYYYPICLNFLQWHGFTAAMGAPKFPVFCHWL
jgi:hypothetical protein